MTGRVGHEARQGRAAAALDLHRLMLVHLFIGQRLVVLLLLLSLSLLLLLVYVCLLMMIIMIIMDLLHARVRAERGGHLARYSSCTLSNIIM